MEKEILDKDSLGYRYRECRKKLKMSAQDVADKVGLTPQAISKIELNQTDVPNDLSKHAEVLHTSEIYLLYGINMSTDQLAELKLKESFDTIQLPVVSLEDLAKNGINKKEIEEYKDVKMLAAAREYGKNSFYVEIQSDSMISTNPSQISFLPGSFVVCDPSISHTPGDFVLARNGAEQMCVIRQFINEGGVFFLKPLNPNYHTVKAKDFEILAVIVDYYLPIKK